LPWNSTKEGTLSSLQNKPIELRQLFAKVANEALKKGQSEEEAIYAGLAAVKIKEKQKEKADKAQKALTEPTKAIPQHLQAVLDLLNAPERPTTDDSTLGNTNVASVIKNALKPDPDRSLIAADFDSAGRLVLRFDTGETITTTEGNIREYIERIVTIATPSTQDVPVVIPPVFDYLDFDTGSNAAMQTGRLRWNNTDGTLDIGLGGGNVTLQVGQEQVAHIYNNTANAFVDMQVLRVTGSQGQRLTGALAQATTESLSSNTFAVVTEPIAKNTTGFATTMGLVRDVDTSAFPEGAELYLSTTAGAITHIKPAAPYHTVRIGWCVRSNNINGSIFVHIQNGYAIGDLHNVLLTAPADGEILMYEQSTGLWKNKTIESTDVLAKRIDFVGDDVIYKAEAAAGVADSAPLWRIRKIVLSVDGDVTETWADGNSSYNKIWDDRLTYTYY
jgi:hypothetical protein